MPPHVEPETAAQAFTQYQGWAAHARQPWIDAIVLRCQPLLGRDEAAGKSYAAALAAYRRLYDLVRN